MEQLVRLRSGLRRHDTSQAVSNERWHQLQREPDAMGLHVRVYTLDWVNAGNIEHESGQQSKVGMPYGWANALMSLAQAGSCHGHVNKP